MENFKNYDVDSSFIKLVSGNADNLPFEDGEFDFVCLDGVFPHLPTLEQVEKVFSEMARVTKLNGYFFTSYVSQGDSLMDALDTALRSYYRNNKDFADFVNNVSPKLLNELFVFLEEKIKQHTGETIELDFLKKLFDEDFCITIQNTIQCHTRQNFSPDYFSELFAINGFGEPTKLKRYVKRNNIRKFVAPLHFYDENYFAKLFYSNGYVDCIAQKKNRAY